MCCAQGYNNAATKAKIHRGVQAILKKKAKTKCLFVMHLWTVCITCVLSALLLKMHCVCVCVPFIGSFFAAFTHQWDVLIDFTGVSVEKRLSTTNWSAHHAADELIKESLISLWLPLKRFLIHKKIGHEKQSNVVWLLSVIFLFCATRTSGVMYFRNCIQEFNFTQQYLQIKGISVYKVVTKLEALWYFLHKKGLVLRSGACNWTGTFKIREIWNLKKVSFKKRMTEAGTIFWSHSARKKKKEAWEST